MRDFDHPNVMKFLGMCFDAPEGYPYIILPYMSNGSLLEYLKQKSNASNTISGYPEVIHWRVKEMNDDLLERSVMCMCTLCLVSVARAIY